MGAKGFFISKSVGVAGGVLAAGAVATIIALSVVYSQEKIKNDGLVSPTDGGGATPPPSPPPTDGGGATPPPSVSPTTATTPIPSNEPWDKYRLPKSLVPDHYNVTLWPRLQKDPTTDLYIFTGDSTVTFKCVAETDLILIHSNKLNYTELSNGSKAELTAVGGGPAAPAIQFLRLEAKTQYLVIQLTAPLVQNQNYTLHTKFTGELADDLGGFYRSEYIENNETKIVATTQMQPTDARKAFPCFDEPAMKAVFHITLIHDHDTIALSNGMETGTNQTTVDGKDVLVTVFEPTKKMSTYLLAFIVCDFDYINTTDNGVLIRIYARKEAIAAQQGEYALKVTGPILNFFENYYNTSYPLPKSDQIALPDFNAGAMENWGLITYRETALLYSDNFSSNSNKERIATIISHELAHMWFGNLVTLNWWNDLWLNEGFASYVEYLGANHAEPSWDVTDLIVLNDIHRVFAVDALASSHPLSSKEDDIQRPEQISELFDAISYSKGASVLRMLSDFLTEDLFKVGLSSYLNTFAYGNTVYTDLWHHLQSAVDNASFSLPTTVDEIMNTWVLQMGFPVITINTTTGVVTQKHFLLDPDANVTATSPYGYKWTVPIKWMKNGTVQTPYWLQNKSVTEDQMKMSGADWLLANLNTVGYYRVNYDQDNWNRLLIALSTDHEKIPVINRAQLIDDAFNLARAKEISTILALKTTTYLKDEREYMPWESALDNLDFFFLMFDRSEVLGPMQSYLQNQVTPLFHYFKNMTGNWTSLPVGHMDQYNQVNAISKACSTGLKECQDLVQKWFQDWMTAVDNDVNAVNMIKPNLRSTVYCNAIAAGGADEWNFAWKQFQNATIASEAEKLRAALACTKKPWLLNRYLKYTLNSTLIRKQDATSTIVYIAANVVGQSLAWDFIRDRWSYIFTQYGGGSFSFSNLINGVTKRFSSPFELQQLEQFKEDNAAVGFGSGTLAVEQAIERTKANIKWVTENEQQVLNWFKDNP